MSILQAEGAPSGSKKTRPLDNIRVLDMSALMTGPLCTQILADYGADVIKVERPGGDVMRHAGPMRNPRMGPMYLHANRNKRSICLDAKHPDATAAILRLASTCDVFVHNIRPAAMARLGLSYDDFCAARPDIIYVSLVGYGQDGPYAAKPAVDEVIQAAAGIVELIERHTGEPRYVPSILADRITGISAAHAVLAALFQRSRTGEGQAIEIPMYETLAAFVLSDHLGGLTFEPPIGPTGYNRLVTPFHRPYPTLDGHIAASVYNDKQWKVFLRAIGKEALYHEDPRFHDAGIRARHYDEVYRMLGEIFSTRTTADWLKLLSDCDIPCSVVRRVDDLLDDPHLRAVDFFEEFDHPHEGRLRTMRVPSRWSGADMSMRRYAPRVGEQTREVLGEAGYSGEEIENLFAAGAANDSPTQ